MDSGLVCPMHRQLTPNHAQQMEYGTQWVHTLVMVIPGTVHLTLQVTLHRLESHMLGKSVSIHSDSLFRVGVKMDTDCL